MIVPEDHLKGTKEKIEDAEEERREQAEIQAHWLQD